METKVKTRKIIKSGGSLLITLPREFTRKSGLSKGDTVAVAYDGLFVIINPNKPKGVKNNNEER